MQTPRVKIDARRKLSEETKQEIYRKYHDTQYKCSQRTLAKDYNVSRRLIQFIIAPEKLKAMQEKNAKEQHWKKYYNRKQLTSSMQNWRNKLKADPETKKVYLDYSHKLKAEQWKRKTPKPCPLCQKVVKALRDHIRKQHNK